MEVAADPPGGKIVMEDKENGGKNVGCWKGEEEMERSRRGNKHARGMKEKRKNEKRMKRRIRTMLET